MMQYTRSQMKIIMDIYENWKIMKISWKIENLEILKKDAETVKPVGNTSSEVQHHFWAL